MGYCTNCGYELGIGRFCTNCGQPIAGRHSGVPAAPPGPPGDTVPPPPRYPLYADTVPGPRPTAPPETAPVATPPPPPPPPAGGPDEAEPGRIGWLVAMIAGVTAVIAAVVGVVMVVDDEPTAEEEPPEAGPVGDATPLIRRVKVPGTAPASTDAQTGEPVTFEASHLYDGDETTCWRVAGDATGESLTVVFSEPVQVSRLGMVNGYAKSYPGYDGYQLNRRVLAVDWVFDDGTRVSQQLADDRAMQSTEVPPTWTKRLTIELVEVSAPGGGTAGRDYTAISELLVEGATAID